MGGFGSGRGQRGKDTTSDMRPLDIRKLQRDGLLTAGRAFGWHWTVNGEEVASIQMRTEVDRVILNYRSRSNGGEWQPMEYPVYLEWTGLQILDVVGGGPDDRSGVVDFAAHYRDGRSREVLRERSRFERRAGRWFYVDGDLGAG